MNKRQFKDPLTEICQVSSVGQALNWNGRFNAHWR